MDKYIIAIGGGEIKEKKTVKIDEYICNLAKKRAGDKRAVALFIGTASHDFMPYYNSFHKIYTGIFGLKTDCVLLIDREIDMDKIKSKFYSADLIYVGGGDTLFMLEQWEKQGITGLIRDAYNRGVILCGLSAGAICWFEKMYTDSKIMKGESDSYFFENGLGWLKGTACPHYDERKKDFMESDLDAISYPCLCMENLSALVFVNEVLIGQISTGGNSYSIIDKTENIVKSLII